VEVEEAIDEPTYSNEIIQDRTSAEVRNSELFKKCLRSLAFPEIDARLHSIEQADKDTCRWIFESTQFRNWESRVDMASHNGVLWIKGKPGAGKSTLMKQIWLHLRKESGDSLLAAFFFHGRGKNALEKSPLGMLRSVLYQFLEQNARLCEVFLPIFLDKQRKHGVDIQWHFGELKSFLLSSVETLGSDPIVLLVDALDECMDEEVQSVVTFLESLACSAVESDKTLNICLASRHYPQIRIGKVDELVIETHSEHDKDIMEYVRHNLIIEDTEVEQEILLKSALVFLWVELVVKMLNKAYNDGRVRAMKKVLRDVPSDLDDLYCELLTKGRNSDEIRETVSMLQWVLFAQKVLSPEALYFTVLSDTDPDRLGPWDQEKEPYHAIQRYITSTSKGLIEVWTLSDDDNSSVQSESEEEEDTDGTDDLHGKVVQFIHESVKDFLVSVKGLQSLDSSLGKDIIGQCHSRLANCCLSYIMMRSLEFLDREDAPDVHESHLETGKSTDPTKLYPFLSYASVYILDHIEAAEVGGVSQVEVLVNLQQGSKEIRRIQNIANFVDIDTWKDKAEVIHVAAGKGFYETFMVLLEELKVNVNAVGSFDGTALQAAARGGFKNIVELCLDHGADVNTMSSFFGTALQAAATSGHEKIVQLCLDHGADVNAVGGSFGTALQAAAARGHENIVHLCLDHGADVNTMSGFFGTALQAAANSGHEKIVQLCLDHGADVNAVGGFFGTALQAAARPGNEKIVQLFLDHCADVNAKGGYYCTALHVAAIYGGSRDVVKILLEHGADVNARDGKWGTALHTAKTWDTSQACIDLLLQYGAEDLPPIKELSEEETGPEEEDWEDTDSDPE
jgi:ankyrin repeat protein